MNQTITLTVEERAIGCNISLYPTERAMLKQIAKDHGLGSISAAVRFVLHDWMKLRKPSSNSPRETGGEETTTPSNPLQLFPLAGGEKMWDELPKIRRGGLSVLSVWV
jgi:hypothetical protein